jgi:hypothetical protein
MVGASRVEIRDSRHSVLWVAYLQVPKHKMPRARLTYVSYFDASCTPTIEISHRGTDKHVAGGIEICRVTVG